MWKRGGRSSALDRAQALLSAKRNRRGDTESTERSAPEASAYTGLAVKSTSVLPNPLFSDLSDLPSVSSDSQHGVGIVGPADAWANQGRGGVSTMSSLEGAGNRFLKKAPTSAAFSKSPIQQGPEPRYLSSSQRGSQNAALSRLAEIENQICSGKQAQEQARQELKPVQTLTLDISPEAAAQSPEAPLPLSAQSSSDQSLKGKRFQKNQAAVSVHGSPAAVAPKRPNAGVRSRAEYASVPLVGVTKSARVVSGVSLESAEEDTKRLLGDSVDSADNSLLRPGRLSSMRVGDKMSSRKSQKVCSSSPPAAFRPPSSSNTQFPHSSPSPSRRSSPFRFTGQAQAHFSPSVLSPSSSPPCVSPSPPGTLGSTYRPSSPQSSISSRQEVLSLEDLFPVNHSSDVHSEMSLSSSEDFKMNLMGLDDVVPGFTKETRGKKQCSAFVVGSPNGLKKEEEVLDYQSDFEGLSRTEPESSASQISEHIMRDGEEEEVVSEVREKAAGSYLSHRRTEDDYSSTLSDSSRNCTSRTSDCSQTAKSLSRIKWSGSSEPHGSKTSSSQSKKPSRKGLREAAVQTERDPLASTCNPTLGSAMGRTLRAPGLEATYTTSPEYVGAFSTYNPSMIVLIEMLKQQLAMSRQFIDSSRHLHSRLVQSLEPPNYKYTTLEDTKMYIRKHRVPKLTMEEALEEVMQQMGEQHLA